MHLGTWIKRVLLGLTLGLVATVAVAWRIALITEYADDAPTASTEWIIRGPGGFYRIVEQSRGPGCRLRRAFPVLGFDDLSRSGAGVVATGERPGWVPPDFTGVMSESHVGWPLLALRSGARAPGSRSDAMPHMSIGAPPTTYTLPIMPLWGFFGDVAFYAGVYVLIATGVARILRRRADRSPRLRCLARLAVHLLAAVAIGVLLTVAVAWTVALRPTSGSGVRSGVPQIYRDPVSKRVYTYDEFRGFGWETDQLFWLSQGASPTTLGTPPSWAPIGLASGSWSQTVFGWPLHALRTGYGAPGPGGEAPALPVLWLHTSSDTHILPIVPIWTRFGASVAIYAVPYLALVAGLGRLRRRRRRGCCPSCGYNLHGLGAGTPCPECGTLSQPPAQ